jgi:hypothetical protein
MKGHLSAVAALSIVIALSASQLRAQEKIDPTGTWGLRITMAGRPPNESTLRIEKAGDTLVGVLSDFRGRSTPIKDVQLKDGELSFRVVFNRDGREFVMSYAGKMTADTYKGKFTLNFLGQKRVMDFEGQRKKEEATLVGSWKITVVLEGGQKLQPTLRLKEDRRGFSGTYIGTSGKEVPVQDLKVVSTSGGSSPAQGELSFRVTGEIEHDKLTFNYAGKVNGNEIQGTVKLVAGTQSVSLKFQARKIETPTANVAGTWKLKVPYSAGVTFDPVLKLVQTGATFKGTYAGEHGETPIADALILGDEFTFEVARSQNGKSYKLRYQGRVSGDTLKGSVEYDFDGINGVFDFDGQRVPGANSGPEKKP